MYIYDADINLIVEQIKQLPRQQQDTVLLLIGEHSIVDVNGLMLALNDEHIPFVGGIFPSVIYGNERYDKGIVTAILPMVAKPSVVKRLNILDFELIIPNIDVSQNQYTALILVDGLTKYTGQLLDILSNRFGTRMNYVGGGAGSLSFEQKPCVFDNTGIYQDAAIILWIKASSQLGVRHGWQHLLGPQTATRADGPVLYELDGRPAFEFYRQIIEKRTRKILTRDNFFSIAKEYPLGIYHPGMDYIVRDPITFTEDGALVCVGEIPERSMIYILRGNKESLIDNARLATHEAVENSPNSSHHFVVDCISRVLYLDDDFDQELAAVSDTLRDGASKPFGILSLGEIATYGTGRVEFFNKTFVLGSLSATD